MASPSPFARACSRANRSPTAPLLTRGAPAPRCRPTTSSLPRRYDYIYIYIYIYIYHSILSTVSFTFCENNGIENGFASYEGRPGATMPAYDFESAKAVRLHRYRYMYRGEPPLLITASFVLKINMRNEVEGAPHRTRGAPALPYPPTTLSLPRRYVSIEIDICMIYKSRIFLSPCPPY